mmetsp:Transcript_8583/g.25834  ORF Transcript_8583/g.25834 Transcript_8583/m.25834 type:complete len:137 (-) Transcript_8583:394-804(-)
MTHTVTAPKDRCWIFFRATKKIWAESYGTEYAVPGGMYRGEPPDVFFSEIWALQQVDFPLEKPMATNGLVGKVGASSTGPPDDGHSKIYDAEPWTEPNKTTLDGSDAFIEAAQMRSTRWGVVASPKKDNYIFGRES